MEKNLHNGKAYLKGYDIVQKCEGDGQISLHLTVVNFEGRSTTYDGIIADIEQLLRSRNDKINESASIESHSIYRGIQLS